MQILVSRDGARTHCKPLDADDDGDHVARVVAAGDDLQQDCIARLVAELRKYHPADLARLGSVAELL